MRWRRSRSCSQWSLDEWVARPSASMTTGASSRRKSTRATNRPSRSVTTYSSTNVSPAPTSSARTAAWNSEADGRQAGSRCSSSRRSFPTPGPLIRRLEERLGPLIRRLEERLGRPRPALPAHESPERLHGDEALAEGLVEELVGPVLIHHVDKVQHGAKGVRNRNPQLRRDQGRIDLGPMHLEREPRPGLLRGRDFHRSRAKTVETPESSCGPVGSAGAGAAPKAGPGKPLLPTACRAGNPVDPGHERLKSPCADSPPDGGVGEPRMAHLSPCDDAMLAGSQRH